MIETLADFRNKFQKERDLELRLYIEEELSYEKIAEQFSRSSRTPLLHIQKHNKAILKSGFCSSCKIMKSRLETLLVDKS